MQQTGYEMRAAHVGGNLNNGVNDGPSYWNLNNTASNANANIGARTLISVLELHLVIRTAWWK